MQNNSFPNQVTEFFKIYMFVYAALFGVFISLAAMWLLSAIAMALFYVPTQAVKLVLVQMGATDQLIEYVMPLTFFFSITIMYNCGASVYLKYKS